MKGEAGAHHSELTLEDRVLRYIGNKGTVGVRDLYYALSLETPSLTRIELTDSIRRLAGRDLVDVEDIRPHVRSLIGYLGLWERNVWFYASVFLSLITVCVIYALPTEFPLGLVRWILGGVFVLFLPGYVTVEALFPRSRDLDAIERVALSIGLSLALSPLVGLLLNYTPWGIRLTPFVISLAIFTLGLAGVGVGRQYRIG